MASELSSNSVDIPLETNESAIMEPQSCEVAGKNGSLKLRRKKKPATRRKVDSHLPDVLVDMHQRIPPGQQPSFEQMPRPVEYADAQLEHHSRQLELSLRRQGCWDTPENEARRRESLSIIEKRLCQWASSIQALRQTSDNKWQRPRVSLVTFGSYRLKVHRPESDLDVLALSPSFCTRADFFSSLVKQLQAAPEVRFVHSIETAFTPVIKLLLTNGIHVDMLFGRVADTNKLLRFQQTRLSPLLCGATAGRKAGPSSTQLPQDRSEYMIEDDDLRGTDEAGVRSLNGVRVTQMVLEAVPDQSSFRILLTAVRQWAVSKGLYSNVLGFLGGINYAILAALICQKHPNAPTSTLLRVFFRTFSLWKWPKPVFLCQSPSTPPPGVPFMSIWDPKNNPRDARCVMPIITPAYPSMNSSFNVGIPQRRRIQEEMTRAALSLAGDERNWPLLFKPTDFFQRHANFLQIVISAQNTEQHLKWCRFCESKLRFLISAVETTTVSAWPFAKIFTRACKDETDSSDKVESYFFIGLRFDPTLVSADMRYTTSDFLHTVMSWEEREVGMDLTVGHVLQADLPSFVLPAVEPLHGKTGNLPSDYSDTPQRMNKPQQATRSVQQMSSGATRLTPKLARSTLSDDILASPTKKARTGV